MNAPASEGEGSQPGETASEKRARARLGTTLNGKWHLDSLLGVGGMAAVYSATHRNGKRVAIKLLHGELRDRPELLARFRREGYVANKVGHPGAVSVIDDDVAEDGSVYMVMDLLTGGSLEELRLRRGGTLPLQEALTVIEGILEVLVAAHAQGIVHRDMKPDNVFVLHDGQVRVLDFGIAGLREQAQDAKVTMTGSVMGTPGFMSPEQARGLWESVDAQTDVWAVGATLFTLLSGRCLHQGRSINEGLMMAMTQTVPPVRTLVSSIPESIAEWLDRALAFEKEQRWPDAGAMLDAAREARRRATDMAPVHAQTQAIPYQTTFAGQVAQEPLRAKKAATGAWLAVGLAGLFAVLAIGGFLVIRTRSQPAPIAPAPMAPSLAPAAHAPEKVEPTPAMVKMAPPPLVSAPESAAPESAKDAPTPKAARSAKPASSASASASAPASSASTPFDPLGRRK